MAFGKEGDVSVLQHMDETEEPGAEEVSGALNGYTRRHEAL